MTQYNDPDSKKRVCPADGKFLTRTSMYYHNESSHMNQTWTCDLCPKTFKTKRDLKIHINKDCHSKSIFPCDKCDKTF